jgi:hypothetical protein
MKSLTEYPVYRVNYSMEDDKSGINLVSIVEDPAIQLNSIALSEENEVEVYFSNEDEMRIVGPALVPDKMIFRKANGGYFIYFTKEDIKNLVKKFNRTGDNKRIGLDHNGSVSDAYINEQWIVEDPTKDKSAYYNFNVESGTWMLDVQVTDNTLWNELKNKKSLGFSIEALLGLKINEVSMNDELENEVVDTNVETNEVVEPTNSEITPEVEAEVETVETSEVETETNEENVETTENVEETTEEVEVETELAADTTANPVMEPDLNAKVTQMELMMVEMMAKIEELSNKVSNEVETNMKNEATMELARHSKTYDDVLSGEQEFRHLKREDKSKYLVDRVEQLARLVKKNK